MPATPNSADNFILGLSDFWTKIFQEAPALAVMYDAMQLSVGQSYLDLLSDVLAVSVADAPLFSKRYYQYVPIREDQLRYREGAAPGDDRYVFSAPQTYAALPSLMNRVIAPTVLLEDRLDYALTAGEVAFRRNLFDVDGAGNALAGVPQRSVQVQFPYDFLDVTVRDWAALGVRSGDLLRVRFLRGTTVEVEIALARTRLALAGSDTAFEADVRGTPYTIDVLRVPYNTAQRAVDVPHAPSLETRVAACAGVYDGTYHFVQAAPGVDFTATDGVGRPLYVDKYLYIDDPVYDENSGVFRIRAAIDAQTADIDRPAPFYNPPAPAWVSGAAYAKRAVVLDSGNVYYALEAHTAGASFAADLAAGRWALYLLDLTVLDYQYPTATPPAIPVSRLPHEFLIEGSVQIYARRLYARRVGDVVYPANEQVVEGVDYVLDLDGGRVFHLSAWDSVLQPRANYEWRLRLYHRNVAPPRPWTPGHFYYVNDAVRLPDGTFWYAVEEGLSGARFELDAARWRALPNPFGATPVYPARELAFWAPDVAIDEQRLYNNFGYLLAGDAQASTEAYRAFLQGVMQLFVMGPAVQRLESALNVMGGLPVVRDDGEVLQSYDNGVVATGEDGVLVDGQLIRGGSFLTTGQLTNPEGNFFATDLLATVTVSRAANPLNNGTYVVQVVNAPGDVFLTPTPLTDEIDTEMLWRYEHVALNRQFTAASYVFTAEDVGGYIVIETASNATNVGSFKILAVLSAHTVLLEAPQGFLDETGLSWKFTRRNSQLVTTSARTYEFPLLTPMRRDLALTASVGTLAFTAFEPLSTAFQVLDYLVDPTWFHNLTLPPELLQLTGDEAGRRRVATTLIPHVVGALDGAASGDPGLVAGADDEGLLPSPRKAALTWTGGATVFLDEPIAQPADLHQYLAIGLVPPPLWAQNTAYALDDEVRYGGAEYVCTVAHTSGAAFNALNWVTSIRPWAAGSYEITAVSDDGLRVTLDRWPSPELAANAPLPGNYRLPRAEVSLPPFLHRRVVGFVVMDRFLKYHAFRVRINTRSALNATLVAQLTTLIGQTKPSYTFVFVDPATMFTEHVAMADSISLGVGVHLAESLPGVDNDLVSGTQMQSGDAYSYLVGTTAGNFAGGSETIAVVPAIPGWAVAPYRTYLCFVRLTQGNNADGSRVAREGIDYTVDYNLMQVKITNGLAGNPYTIAWVCTLVRNIGVPSAANGETPIVAGGSDPTVVRPSSMVPSTTAGIIDRAVTLKVT